MGQIVPSPHLAKLRLTVNTNILPGGKNSSVVLCLCNLTLTEWSELRGRYLLD